ncbi:porin family protein [Agrobacterium vitis]|uniref:Outer membrane beta-barrel protein n=1 Tax=Agrobacterium vitis TaxID=373 RepID=A0AAE5AVK9_AGRVI|nr:outer membrane protein [Agrobacterium vitis]MCF1499337.1 porin family protein [Allorhizobium sp. Av2]MCM2439412.1 porin family protein [Agrobacterium vitis]MUZ57684.1 outer membrane beta-barrel protein [Agrobacterium vitis]
MKAAPISLFITLAASTAMAADVVNEPPVAPPAEVVAPAFTWTGPYLGIQGGGGWLDGNFSAAGVSGSENFDGGRLGGFAGYQYQFDNNFVLGIEGDVSYDWNDKTYSGLGVAAGVGTDWSGSVRGRVGYAFDKALIYATGGWAATRASIDVSGLGEEKKTFNGYTIGVGVDYAFTSNIFGRLEYRYNDYGNKDFEMLGVPVSADLTQHIVTVGIGVKF